MRHFFGNICAGVFSKIATYWNRVVGLNRDLFWQQKRSEIWIDNIFLFKDIKESDYFTERGEFRVDSEGSPTLLNCLMYKLSYYR